MDLASLETLFPIARKGMEFVLILVLTAVTAKMAKGFVKRSFGPKAPNLVVYAQQYAY